MDAREVGCDTCRNSRDDKTESSKVQTNFEELLTVEVIDVSSMEGASIVDPGMTITEVLLV